MYRVILTKYRATWQYVTHNPQGGSFGSSHCGTLTVALYKATRGIPNGAQYALKINGKSRGIQTKSDIAA